MVALNDLVSEVKIVDSSTPVLDRITASMNRVADAEQKMQAGIVQTDTKVQGSTRSLTAAANSFEALKRASDPVYANLQQLANAQVKLTDAVAKGVATQEEAAAVYAGLKAQSDATIASLNSMGDAHGRVAGQATQMREAMVIVHELLSGNYKRAIGSATIELQNFGLMHTVVAAAMSPVGLAVIAGTAGLIAYAVAAYQVHEGQKAVADALKLTGDAAGISADGVETFAQSMGAAGDVSTKQARSIAAAFIQAGVSTKVWTSLAPDVKNFAELTGGDMAAAQKTLAEAVGGPIDKFIELDHQYNLVSDAQLQHIKNLQEQGRNTDAQALKTQALDARFSHAADTTKTWAGFFRFLGDAANQAWDALGRIGQSDPLEKQIETVKSQIAYLQTQKSGLSQAGLPSIVSFFSGNASQNLENLQALKDIQDQTAALEEHRLQMQLEGKQADDLARSYDANGTEAQKLTNDIALMSKAMADGSGNTDLLARSLDIAKQKLKDIQDPTNSTWRAIQSQGRILAAGPANSLERSQQQAIETATQGGRVAVAPEQLDNLRTEVASSAQDQLGATNQQLQQQAQLQKLLSSATAGTVQQQAAAQRTQVLYAEALKVGGVAMAQLVLEGKPLPPQLQQTSAALAKIDAEKFAGNIGKINAEFSLSVNGSVNVAKAYLDVGQAAGWAAEALKQAGADSVRTGESVAARQRQILTQRVADAAAAAAQESDVMQQQVDGQQAIADSISKGYDAEHQARLQAQIDQATDKDNTALEIAQKLNLTDVVVALTQAINDKTDALKKSDAASSQAAAETALRTQRENIDLLKQEVQENTGDNREHAVKIQHLKDENELKKISAGWTEDEKRQWLDNADAIAQANAQLQHQADIISTAKTLAHDVATSLYEGLTGKTSSIVDWARSTFKRVAAAAIEANIVLPVTMDIVNSAPGLFGISSAGSGGGAGGSGVSGLLSTGGSLNSLSGSLGGPTLGSSLGITGNGGFLDSAGSYLFGSSGSAVSQLGGDSYIPSASEEMANISAPSSGLLGSGGSFDLSSFGGSASAAPTAALGGGLASAGAGFFAGNLVGGALHSPGYGALAGAGAGAAAGALIGTFVFPVIGTAVGAILGGIAGAIGGALGGQHPTVGPNSGGWVNTINGVATAGIAGADNGGSLATANEMQKATIAAIGTLTASIGGLPDLASINVGTFGGKYFGGLGPGTPQNAVYTQEGDAVANGVLAALKAADLSKVDPNVKTAVSNIAIGTDATTISNDITFATNFSAAVNAMKTGVVDFTQAAQEAALTTATQLTTSIQNFKSTAASLGLSTQDAADATKAAVESFLGLTQSQPVSALEQSVETLYGKLQGISGLLSEVGIDQSTATAKVADQVRQMLGITQAIPDNAIADQIASVKQTFVNLSDILTKLGITADQAAKAMQAAIDQIQQNVGNDLASRFNSSAGLDILNTLKTAAAQQQSDLNNVSAAGLGSDWQAIANGTFNNTVYTALNGIAGNTGALDAVIKQYANDTTATGKFIEAAALQIKGFGTVIVGVGADATQASQQMQTAMGNLRSWLASNLTGSLSPLSPQAQLSAASSQYNEQYAMAQGGNLAATQSLTTYADAYLKAAQAMYASSSQYSQIYAQVVGQVAGIPGVDPNQSVINAIDTLKTELATSVSSSGIAVIGAIQQTTVTDPVVANALNLAQDAIGKAISDMAGGVVNSTTATTTAIDAVFGALGKTLATSDPDVRNALVAAQAALDQAIGSAGASVTGSATATTQAVNSVFTALGNTLSTSDPAVKSALSEAQSAIDQAIGTMGTSVTNSTTGTTGAVTSLGLLLASNGALGTLVYNETNILHADLQAVVSTLQAMGVYLGKVSWNTGQTAGRLGGAPTYATGGYHSGGLRLVGENGPEIEATGPSRIWDASTTRRLLTGANDNSSSSVVSTLLAINAAQSRQIAELTRVVALAGDRQVSAIREGNTSLKSMAVGGARARANPLIRGR